MAINLFNLMGHCVGIAASFLVLAAAAIAIDFLLRWCERHHVTPSLLKILHRTALALVVLDATLILAEAGQETWLHVKPMFVVLAANVGTGLSVLRATPAPVEGDANGTTPKTLIENMRREDLNQLQEAYQLRP